MRDFAPVGDGTRIRVPKAAEVAAAVIRRQIVTRSLQQDDALPSEASLMQEFNISRPTLREAFRILESQGLITVRRGPRGGARVQEPSAEIAATYAGLVLQHRSAKVDDVMKARVIVEAPAARMLAERDDRAASAEVLQDALDTIRIDRQHFHEFNALVVELTQNQTLILLTAMLEEISRAAALKHTIEKEEAARLMRKTRRTRQRLIELVRAGDGDGAEELWRKHLTEAGNALTSSTGEPVVDLFN